MKATLALIMIVTSLLLAGCACESLGSNNVPTKYELIDDCKGDDHCLKNDGIKNYNAEVCAEIYRAGPKSKCFLEIAEENKDASMCERMESGAGAYAKEECYYHVALEKNDPSICDKISRTYEGSSTDLTKKGFNYEMCVDKTSKGATLKKECGEVLLPCCGDSQCEGFHVFCNPSFRCEGCGLPGQPCCPPGMDGGNSQFCLSFQAYCSEGKCIPCGGKDQDCCDDYEYPCQTNDLTCDREIDICVLKES